MEYEVSCRAVSKNNPALAALTFKYDDDILDMDRLDLSKANKREEIVGTLIEKYPALKPERDKISKRLMSLADELLDGESSESENKDEVETPLERSKQELDQTKPELIAAAEAFLQEPNLVDLIVKHIEILGLVGEKSLGLAIYLVFVSRLLAKPLAVVVMGVSSSGKSFAISLIARLFPLEAVYNAHRIIPAALNYLPKGSLIHRAVIAGERSRKQDDDQAEVTRALREMLSDGVLRLLSVGKDAEGNMVTKHIEQPGPVAYAESTTLGISKIFDEDRTRFLFLCCNESESQSKRIIERIATEAE